MRVRDAPRELAIVTKWSAPTGVGALVRMLSMSEPAHMIVPLEVTAHVTESPAATETKTPTSGGDTCP
jgi:hypothetical protein